MTKPTPKVLPGNGIRDMVEVEPGLAVQDPTRASTSRLICP
jgi:hypothetical protein